MKLVSIIIPHYNGKELLYNCIKSIYQNIQIDNFEIIVVDNGSTDDSVQNIKQLFSDIVVITMGSEGSVILSKSNNLIKISPFKVNAIDTVGAGDAFAGGFLYGINNGLDYEESGKLASALSSKVVTKLGPRLEKNIIDNIKLSMR